MGWVDLAENLICLRIKLRALENRRKLLVFRREKQVSSIRTRELLSQLFELRDDRENIGPCYFSLPHESVQPFKMIVEVCPTEPDEPLVKELGDELISTLTCTNLRPPLRTAGLRTFGDSTCPFKVLRAAKLTEGVVIVSQHHEHVKIDD